LSPLVTAACALAWYRYRYGRVLTPDGVAYLRAAAGESVSSPFRWRLAARVLGRLPSWAWDGLSLVSLAASSCLVGALATRHGSSPGLASALWLGLPWVRSLTRNPFLLDQVGMLAALVPMLGADLPWPVTVAAALVAGACSERAPVFAAVFAWSPLPLVGLVVPGLAALLTERGPAMAEHSTVADPWRSGRELLRTQPVWTLVAPWGMCLLAAGAATVQVCVAVALGYAQTLVATDRVRLVQWSAPLVCVAAAGVMAPWPAWIVGLVLLVHWIWPWSECPQP
jgi:hypothetical protein